MPTINIIARPMENGDVVTIYNDTVDSNSTTYTFLKTQGTVIIKNKGAGVINYTVGSNSGSLNPSDFVKLTGSFDNFQLSASSKTQAFEVWSEELGGNDTDLASLNASVNANTLSLAGKATVATNNGFTDGNSIEFAQSKRIHLKTDKQWILNEGHVSDLIRLQWISRTDGAGSKPALVWCDDNLNDKTAIIGHDLANDPTRIPHKHISIETTMSPTGATPNELFTRMEWPYDEDVCEIQTHDARFTVEGNYMRVANGDGVAKELRLSRSYSKEDPANFNATTGKPIYDKVYVPRWSIKSDATSETGVGNAGSNFGIARFDDTGNGIDSPFTITRADGSVNINLAGTASVFRLAASTGVSRDIRFSNSTYSNGQYTYSPRWAVRTDNTTESGGNSGSDYRVVRYDDSGNALDTPFFIKRSNGQVGIMTNTPTTPLDVNGNGIRIRTAKTPTSTADASGNIGDHAWDDNYLYVKTSAGWKRSALTTF